MRLKLLQAIDNRMMLEMIYMNKSGVVSKRKVHVINVSNNHFQAYCHLRKCRRTFRIDNVLALSPIYSRESMVV